MDWLLGPEGSLWGLFASAFLSATLLPGSSEAVLLAVLLAHPQQAIAALGVATVGNTLGGMSTYLLARLVPARYDGKIGDRRLAQARRWGPAVLALSWAPVIGDVLCLAAGWLRLPWLPCLLWMAMGKGARYGLIAWLAG